MQVDLIAELPHYREHLLPIWNALPSEAKGTDWGVGPSRGNNALLVAGYSDVKRHPEHQCIYVEHGAGQSYLGLPSAVSPFYSPLVVTKQHRNIIAFICPNDVVASRWAGSYDWPTFVVGCPKLDPWHAGNRPKYEPRTVAITFHWNPPFEVSSAVPELMSGWEDYCLTLRNQFIPRIITDGWHVICHWHPRLGNRWKGGGFEELGVEFVSDGSEVLDRAAILIADNTSLQAEMMSLGRGVVFLNHHRYRKDVSHGGRFWDWPNQTGVSLESPSDLLQLELESVEPSLWHPYAYADGHATERAVEAILSLL